MDDYRVVRRGAGTYVYGAVILLLYIFLLSPILIVVVASFTSTAYLQFPPAGFSLRWFKEIIFLGEYEQSFEYSIAVAVSATIAALVLGTWIALVLARYTFPGQQLLDTLFMSPMVIPELAFGIGLLQYFSELGMFRNAVGMAIGHVCICTPYVIRTVSASLKRFDRSVEESATSLGAPPVTVMRKITLPLIKPGLIAAAIMSFIISFDNVTISIFLSSPGKITLPVRLFIHANETGLNTTLAAVSTLLIGLVVVLMVIVERFVGLDKLMVSPSR